MGGEFLDYLSGFNLLKNDLLSAVNFTYLVTESTYYITTRLYFLSTMGYTNL